jgi:hypothetical protein
LLKNTQPAFLWTGMINQTALRFLGHHPGKYLAVHSPLKEHNAAPIQIQFAMALT